MNTQNLRKFLFLLLLVFSPVYSQSLDKQLFKAIENRDVKAVDNLLKKGANPNAKTAIKGENGTYTPTALMSAIEVENNYEIVKLLIDKGADVNKPDDEEICSSNPIMAAAEYGDLDVVKLLVSKNADVNYDCMETTPLDITAENEDLETANYLIKNRANFVSSLATTNSKKGVELLIKAGANVNAKDEDGMTAIMYAINFHGIERVQLLLNNGADINAKNNEGKTVLDMAIENSSNEQKINFLKSKGAKLGKDL